MSSYIKRILTPIFSFVIISTALYLLLDYYLIYQSNHTLFLLTKSYLQVTLSSSGGILTYISNGIISLIYNQWIGISIVSLLLIGYLYTTLRFKTGIMFAAIATLTQLLMFSEESTPLSLLIGMGITLLLLSVFRPKRRVAAILLSIFVTAITAVYFVEVILAELLLKSGVTAMLVVLFIIYIVTPIYPYIRRQSTPFKIVEIIMVLSLTLFVVYRGSLSESKSRVYTRDAASRGDWRRVLDLNAPENDPDQFSIYYSNLALAHQMRLSESMFSYNQSLGVKGLFFSWDNKRRHSLEDGSLAYAAAGLINEARHWEFESLIAQGESRRTLERLIEYASIINNREEVILLSNRLNNSPLYSCSLQDMGVVSEEDRDGTMPTVENLFFDKTGMEHHLKEMVQQDKYDIVRFEYYMAYLMLTSNLKQIALEIPNYKRYGYAGVPTHWSEALILLAYQQKKGMNIIKESGVKGEHLKRFKEYITLSKRKDKSAIQKQFKDSYWYYLQYLKPKKQ